MIALLTPSSSLLLLPCFEDADIWQRRCSIQRVYLQHIAVTSAETTREIGFTSTSIITSDCGSDLTCFICIFTAVSALQAHQGLSQGQAALSTLAEDISHALLLLLHVVLCNPAGAHRTLVVGARHCIYFLSREKATTHSIPSHGSMPLTASADLYHLMLTACTQVGSCRSNPEASSLGFR